MNGKLEQEVLPHIVCLGGSAGSLEALQEFFRALPPDPGVPFVIVVHLSPDFKSLMSELLSRCTTMAVQKATDDTPIVPNHVYVISPGKNMTVSGGRLRLTAQDRAPGHAPNFPTDLLLSSVAKEFGDRSIALILSGTGTDGSRGVRSIKEAGGVIFVQDPATAKFDGMPMSAIQTGVVDQRGTPAELARRVVDLIGRYPLAPAAAFDEEGDEEGARVIQRILDVIRKSSGLDMSYLRRRMLTRRIHRRMAIAGVADLETYVERLNAEPQELKDLGHDLLIGVTRFFRDAHAFDALKKLVLQDILLTTGPRESVRVWVSACSSGEEAYSIAMLLMEAMSASGIKRDIKIFATDVDPRALDRAAQGAYSAPDIADVPIPLLNRYFEQNGTGYVVRPELRSKLIFAQHNLVESPPFTRMHLVSCRNLLIYLDHAAQRSVLTTLFTALRAEQGILFLGPAESPGAIERSLTCLDSKAKLYRRTGYLLPHALHLRNALPDPVSPAIEPRSPNRPLVNPRTRAELNLLRATLEASFEAERRSAAVVNEESRLVEILTDPLAIFRLPKGKPTDDLARILDRPLLTAISVAQAQLRAGKVYDCVAPDQQEPGKDLHVRMCPLATSDSKNGVPNGYALLTVQRREAPVRAREPNRVDVGSAERVAALELELRHTKENLQSTIEELQSSNEELQSTNEELHSVNEELYTVNAEFHVKNEELLTLTADLNNLLNAMAVATLYLDDDLRIRRFTPSISRIIPLHPSDAGRLLSDFTIRLDTNLVEDAKSVLEQNQVIEREVRDRSGAWVLMQMSPYKAAAGQKDGVLTTFVDVTRIKNTEETARVVSEQLKKTNVKLAHKSEQLEDLFSIVAHDLKRPVAGLDSVLKFARKDLQDGDRPRAEKNLKSAIELLEGLRTMLKDLGAVSQLSHFEATVEETNLRPWLDAMMRPFAKRAEDRGVQLNWSCDNGVFKFARGAAAGILNNLVENAFVHGTSNPDPRVDVSCAVRGELLHLSVTDNGRGIAKEHHGRVFELFRRLHPKETEGSGVGLVAVRRFAQRAQGAVRLQSELGQGAKFMAELPVHTADEEPETGTTILLVEDDELDAKRVRRALEGYDVHWATDLATATNAIHGRRFSLVLLDLSLPDGHGVQLLNPLLDVGYQTPVVILSGQMSLIDDALDSMLVVAVMSKDEVEEPTFVQTIEKALAAKKPTESAASVS